MVFKEQTIAIAIWLNWNPYVEFEFAFQMQYTSFKSNVPQNHTIHIMWQHKHVLVHLHLMLSPFVDDCSGDRRSETVITPEGEEDR